VSNIHVLCRRFKLPKNLCPTFHKSIALSDIDTSSILLAMNTA